MTAVVALVAYFFGALPTAAALARARGVDLRGDGSGNPGTNNALRLSGPSLATSILVVEMTKGALAVLFGGALAGDAGAVVAGIAAVAGNIYNVFYRFEGGKGLGITAGVLFVAWPTGLPFTIAFIAGAVIVTRSSGAATVIALTLLNLLAAVWAWSGWPMAWGIEASYLLVALTMAITILLWRKHWREARFRRPAPV